ncbi:MAG: hypothetical protein HPY94_00225 [Clostridia bacterium]|nr:hypothetical protein [Clostridia bacterium]
MKKSNGRPSDAADFVERKLTCLKKENFLKLSAVDGQAEKDKMLAAGRRERALKARSVNARFRYALIAVCLMLLIVGTGTGAFCAVELGYNGVIYRDTDEMTAKGLVPDCFALPYDLLEGFAETEAYSLAINNDWEIAGVLLKFINDVNYVNIFARNSDELKLDFGNKETETYETNGYIIYEKTSFKEISYIVEYNGIRLLLQSNSLRLSNKVIDEIIKTA